MDAKSRNEYQRIYQRKWRNENRARYIRNQLLYWNKKLIECIGSEQVSDVFMAE